jgi:hypothetical protein
MIERLGRTTACLVATACCSAVSTQQRARSAYVPVNAISACCIVITHNVTRTALTDPRVDVELDVCIRALFCGQSDCMQQSSLLL